MKTDWMRHFVLATGICLLLAGFTIAGCGGGGDSGSTTQAGGNEATNAGAGGEEGGSSAGGGEEELATESGGKRKQAFLAKAEKLCGEQQKSMQAQATAILKQAKSNPSVKVSQSGLVEGVIAPGFEAEAEGLRTLEAPEGDEEEVEAMIAAIERSAVEAREDPKNYVADGRFAKTDDLARQYGLRACGNFVS